VNPLVPKKCTYPGEQDSPTPPGRRSRNTPLAATSSQPAKVWLSVGGLLGGLLLCPAVALGYGQRAAVDLEGLRVAPGDQHLATVDLARVGKHGAWVPQAVLHYADRPVVLSCDGRCPVLGTVSLIEHRLTLDASVTVSLRERVQLGMSLPVVLYQQSDRAVPDLLANVDGNPPVPQVAGLSDASLHAKVAFLPATWRFGAGLWTALSLPTGNGDSYIGTRLPAFTARLLGHAAVQSRITVAGGLGARFAAEEQILNLPSGIALTYNFGMQAQLLGLASDEVPVFLLAEVYGQAYVHSTRDTGFPLEFLFAVKSEPAAFSLFVGAGGTIIPGAGSPDVRALIGLGYRSKR